MQLALRPSLTAGVALATASVIAAAPLTKSLPEVHVPALPQVHVADIQLTAGPGPTLGEDPFSWYSDVINRSAVNLASLGQNFRSNPFPIMHAILNNQQANWGAVGSTTQVLGNTIMENIQETVPPALQTAFTDFRALNVEGGVNTLLNLPIDILGGGSFVSVEQNLAPVIEALQQALVGPIENIATAMNTVVGVQSTPLGTLPVTIMLALGGIAGPFISTPGAVGTAIQDVIDAGMTGNPVNVAYALANGPATVADGFLNGGYGPLINILISNLGYTGLISGNQNAVVGNLAGSLQSILSLDAAIAAAIAPKGVVSSAAAVSAAALPQALNVGALSAAGFATELSSKLPIGLSSTLPAEISQLSTALSMNLAGLPLQILRSLL